MSLVVLRSTLNALPPLLFHELLGSRVSPYQPQNNEQNSFAGPSCQYTGLTAAISLILFTTVYHYRSASVEVNPRRRCVAGWSTEFAEKLGGPPKGDFLEHWSIGVSGSESKLNKETERRTHIREMAFRASRSRNIHTRAQALNAVPTKTNLQTNGRPNHSTTGAAV